MEEQIDVQNVETETTPEPSPEEQQPVSADEPVDENGVPLKNRVAEKERKLNQRLKQLEAQEALLTKPKESTPEVTEDDEETGLRIVREITAKAINERLEPVLARQFLMENPDAADMVEDINRIRTQHPELAGVDKLDIAYKLAKAERMDEEIRKATENTRAETERIQKSAESAAVEGVGKTNAPMESLDDKIKGATSLKELEELAQHIVR